MPLLFKEDFIGSFLAQYIQVDLIWLIHFLSVFYMTGVIWLVQIVHYPLFKWVSGAAFKKYHDEHLQRMGWVVGPVMILQLVTALMLFVVLPVQPYAPAAVLFLSVSVFAATFFISVPLHVELSEGFQPEVYFRLVHTNWIRTLLWTAHAFLCVYLIARRTGLIH